MIECIFVYFNCIGVDLNIMSYNLQNWQQPEEVQCKKKSKFIRIWEFSEGAKNYMLYGRKNPEKAFHIQGYFSPAVKK